MFAGALTAIIILLIIFGSVIVIVWLGTRYSAAKKGFAIAGSRPELQSVQQTMEQMQRDIEEIKGTLADLVIELHDLR
jgi:hypothetical protein